MSERPVLVFDSGIGGLSVLREARVIMPGRRFVYVADDAGFPYGRWDEDALNDRIVNLFKGLIERHDPALALIACNTASTIVMPSLRQTYPDLPFVGTVPAIKPAAERTRSGLVSVLATPGTVKRQYTRDLIRDYADTVHVRLVGSENLAELAETYMRKGFVDEAAVKAEIEPCFVRRTGKRPISWCSPARISRSWSTVCASSRRGRWTGSIRPKPLPGGRWQSSRPCRAATRCPMRATAWCSRPATRITALSD
jgi:glutamate racemase